MEFTENNVDTKKVVVQNIKMKDIVHLVLLSISEKLSDFEERMTNIEIILAYENSKDKEMINEIETIKIDMEAHIETLKEKISLGVVK